MSASDMKLFGFWVYLMTDCVLFGILFATYIVLHKPLPGIFSLPLALTETLVLLVSSFSCGLALLPKVTKSRLVTLFTITFLLGASFLFMELTEFSRLIADGYSWRRGGPFTAFFTLVGTHGLHITLGLIWMASLIPTVFRQGLTPTSMQRLYCLRLFWHFLDVVWIFIFTLVYMMGAYA